LVGADVSVPFVRLIAIKIACVVGDRNAGCVPDLNICARGFFSLLHYTNKWDARHPVKQTNQVRHAHSAASRSNIAGAKAKQWRSQSQKRLSKSPKLRQEWTTKK